MQRRTGWMILLIAVGLFMFTGFIFTAILGMLLDDRPVVKKDSVLRLTLAGLVTEYYPRDAFGREFEGASLQMHDIRQALYMAKHDARIRGVYLKMAGPSLGWAKAQEIREALLDFRQSGKFVTAYMTFCDERSLYLALAADEIYAQPHSFAIINGFAAEVPFVKRSFAMLGIQPQVENIGKYKSAGDIWKRESMSAAHREATEALLQDVRDVFVDAVCARREIDGVIFESAMESGIFQAEELVAAGLIDSVMHEPEIVDLLKTKIYGQGKNRTLRLSQIHVNDYARISPGDTGLGGGYNIGLIYAVGAILPGGNGHNPINGRTMGAGSVIHMLDLAADDDDISAIVLRVDSPGGSGQASDQIWAAVEKARVRKPVVVSMGDVAASGGYWIAMNGDAIVANPLTITGSIGVVSAFFDLSGSYDKLGIDWETVKTNRHADVPTTTRPLTADEWQQFKKFNRDFYNYFVQKVAEGREKTWDEAHEVARGRVWSGRRALGLGLVDSLGGLETALAIAKEMADIDVDARTQWRVFPERMGFVASLLDAIQVRAAAMMAVASPERQLSQYFAPEQRELFRQLELLSRIRNGEVLAVAPFLPDIR